MPNILQMQEILKGIPDNKLMEEMQQPSGSAPSFLVMTELERRKKVRDEYQGRMQQEQTTVAEDIVAPQLPQGQPPASGGIASLQPQAAPPMAPPMRMESGGDIYMRTGGVLEREDDFVNILGRIDKDLLARMVEAEAGGESEDGKKAVASVIVNRILSKNFPKTLEGVLKQPSSKGYQFSPLNDLKGDLSKLGEATEKTEDVIEELLMDFGNQNPVGNAVLFQNPDSASPFPIMKQDKSAGKKIGNHVFYDRYSINDAANDFSSYYSSTAGQVASVDDDQKIARAIGDLNKKAELSNILGLESNQATLANNTAFDTDQLTEALPPESLENFVPRGELPDLNLAAVQRLGRTTPQPPESLDNTDVGQKFVPQFLGDVPKSVYTPPVRTSGLSPVEKGLGALGKGVGWMDDRLADAAGYGSEAVDQLQKFLGLAFLPEGPEKEAFMDRQDKEIAENWKGIQKYQDKEGPTDNIYMFGKPQPPTMADVNPSLSAYPSGMPYDPNEFAGLMTGDSVPGSGSAVASLPNLEGARSTAEFLEDPIQANMLKERYENQKAGRSLIPKTVNDLPPDNAFPPVAAPPVDNSYADMIEQLKLGREDAKNMGLLTAGLGIMQQASQPGATLLSSIPGAAAGIKQYGADTDRLAKRQLALATLANQKRTADLAAQKLSTGTDYRFGRDRLLSAVMNDSKLRKLYIGSDGQPNQAFEEYAIKKLMRQNTLDPTAQFISKDMTAKKTWLATQPSSFLRGIKQQVKKANPDLSIAEINSKVESLINQEWDKAKARITNSGGTNAKSNVSWSYN